MTISYNWLKEYININLSPEDVSKILTSIGLEVESVEIIEPVKGGLKGVVVGQVLTCQKHPDADQLSLTTVDVGQESPLSIVCGAPNVTAGQKVAVATIGSILYFGAQEVVIKKTKIRGELSEGMICAEDELGLGTSHDGIMVLNSSAAIGTPIREYFKLEDDFRFEIGLTPNRIDAASHFGVARDLAAYLNQQQQIKAQLPSVTDFKVDNKNLHIPVELLSPEACPRYSGLTITNVKVGPSPEWLQKKLRAIGLNPINNIVDITNFVLHEVGQPLHAFDADAVAGKRVVVKTLPANTPFVTLDGVERKLHSDDLMICNEREGMCIAGVFGGAKSGVTETTCNIFLESACFNPISIRKTAKRHGLSTDASFRFERGSDPNITVWALKRAAMLIKQIAGGEISSEIVDVYPNPVANFNVDIKKSTVDRLIGKQISVETISRILKSLDIEVLSTNDSLLQLSIPPYRVDVKREADVVEEILRIYGYNNVEIPQRISMSVNHTPRPDRHGVIELVSNSLAANGFSEIMCNSLTPSAYYEKLDTYPAKQSVIILNALSSDLNAMRQTLLFGGLETIAYNANRRNSNLKLFEFGNCYWQNGSEKLAEKPLRKYGEEYRMAMWLTGDDISENWLQKSAPATFYHLKGYVDLALLKLGLSNHLVETDEAPADIFSYGINLSVNGKHLGNFGLVSEKLRRQFDIKNEVFFAELRWDELFKLAQKQQIKFVEIPRFPEVRRDLALLIDKNVSFGNIKTIAEKVESKLIKAINLFDYYQGPKLGENKKSYAISFILRDDTKTLTDKVIDKVMDSLIAAFTKELGAQLR